MYSLDTLQFGQLLELFARRCRTTLGADRFADLCPHTSRLDLQRDLSTLAEAQALEDEDAGWYFSELADPAPTIAILRIADTTVDPQRLLELAELLSQSLAAKAVISAHKEIAPVLFESVSGLPSQLGEFAESIKSKILPNGEIEDSASPELRRIRREIGSMRGRLTKSLEALMRKKGDAIQDAIVTLRNDRFVIPVKADHSGKVNGVAHGASSSGATVFIEPLEAIEANNEIQKLKAKEETEIARILRSFAETARENIEGIKTAAEIVGELDFIKAKTVFAEAFDAVIPEIPEDQVLELVDARHPLLEESLLNLNPEGSEKVVGETNPEPETLRSDEQSAIVPSSFGLSARNSVMIISGANAGGKTVVLKTAGLLSLMAVSGLPVPASKAIVPFYASVMADIGDHQSLAANLSTFTSHISNIASMIEKLRTPALILLDEVGTGTDPDEGSALGVAIVDHFRRAGAQVMASTHYKGLKTYAANDDDVVNASVEFDEKTLQPTYKLLTGLAGASSGLEIARRFGIRDEVIDKARENLDTASQKAAGYLRQLQTETKKAEDLRQALEEEREATAHKYSRLDIDFQKKERSRSGLFEQELKKVVLDFENEARQLLKTVKDKKEKKKLEKKVAAARAELGRRAAALTGETAAGAKKTKTAGGRPGGSESEARKTGAPIEPGSSVLLKNFGTVGNVEKVEAGIAFVTVGSVRMKQKIADLEAVDAAPAKRSSGKSKKSAGSDLDARVAAKSDARELNLIGMTTLDAEDEVDRFLDDSYAARIMRVRIIHGHGTGALRKAVQSTLKGHPHVESFGFAPQNEGGHGATIVELKE